MMRGIYQRKLVAFLLMFFGLLDLIDGGPSENKSNYGQNRSQEAHDTSSGESRKDSVYLMQIASAYPQFFSVDTYHHVRWLDGRLLMGQSFSEKDNARTQDSLTLQNQMAIPYPQIGSPIDYNPPINYDPGRFRNADLFAGMYGNTKSAVEANLTTIQWMPKSGGKAIQITHINGVSDALQLVSQELDDLPGYLKKYVVELGGTYNWRLVRGGNQLSPHAYGIAVDINPEFADYWLWDSSKAGLRYRNRIPLAIVKIFEQHGFIWGGRWYHYDTMHFEFRPELLEHN